MQHRNVYALRPGARRVTSLSLAWLTVVVAAVTAGGTEEDGAVWVGHRFRPEQLVALHEGEATFTRKLCTITYRMQKLGSTFIVEGQLVFNPRLVPRRPRAIDLEILLINARHICTRQINQHHPVSVEPVRFVFRVPPGSDGRFLRTYYTLHYH